MISTELIVDYGPHEEDPDPPRCPACGVPWRDHLGATGTCQQLQDAIREVERLRTLVRDADDLMGMFRLRSRGEPLPDGYDEWVERSRAADAPTAGVRHCGHRRDPVG